MSDKTEEQIVRERAAVEAMRNAKANMATALDRIETLERALGNAASAISRFKAYAPTGVYVYGGQKTAHDEMNEAIAAAKKLLA